MHICVNCKTKKSNMYTKGSPLVEETGSKPVQIAGLRK